MKMLLYGCSFWGFFVYAQIGEFYSKDPFGLELGLEFWCPTESLQHTSLQGSYLGMALQRPPHKQVRL